MSSQAPRPPHPRRSLLFFPASRPDRFGKAVGAGADTVCIDLEDAVAAGDKDDARSGAVELLRQRGASRAEILLRINSVRTEAGLRDVLALVEAGGVTADALMLPKVETPEEVHWVEALLGPMMPELTLIPMVETGRGLEQAVGIAAASPRVTALMFGGVDLAAELGCAMEWDALLYARSRVVHAAKQAGVDVFDMPFLDVSNAQALLDEAVRAASLGFTGKAAIHPKQVSPIHQAFSPSADAVRHATKVIAAYERNRGGVLLVDGQLVERPVIRRAERTLAIAAAMGGHDTPGEDPTERSG